LKHSKRVATFFSLVPGAGHMYLGLTRQGIQLMVLFFSTFFIAASFDLQFLAVFLPVIWFYSIFDTRTKSLSEDPLPNTNLPIFSDVNSMDDIFKNKPAEKYIAYILILMGVLSLINNIALPILRDYFDYQIIMYAKSLIISFIFIVIGFTLLKSKKVNVKKSGDKLCSQEE
jgi:TM2 domain-containing membrane protein YozV